MIVICHQKAPQQRRLRERGCFYDQKSAKIIKRGGALSLLLLLLLIPLELSNDLFFVNAERWAISTSIPFRRHHHHQFLSSSTTAATIARDGRKSSISHRQNKLHVENVINHVNTSTVKIMSKVNKNDKQYSTDITSASDTNRILSFSRRRRRPNRHFAIRSYNQGSFDNDIDNNYHHKGDANLLQIRGGGRMGYESPTSTTNNNAILVIARIMAIAGETLVPIVIVTGKTVVSILNVIPQDAIIAQSGLLYCFAGGYYPTLFASVQAAKQCGWESAMHAISDLSKEATIAVDAILDDDNYEYTDESKTHVQLIAKKTKIVLKNVDPAKINQALGSLYTTWVGIEAVLHRQFASTISMAITIADYSYPLVEFTVGNPLRLVIAKDYHHWVPVLVEWSAKSIAVKIAWRMQRVRSTYSSAIAGGFIFSKAFFRVLEKRIEKKKIQKIDDDEEDDDENNIDVIELKTIGSNKKHKFGLEDIVAIAVAGLGLYSQLNREAKKGFSFTIPYPFKLLTWPFDALENWIQWHITKEEKK